MRICECGSEVSPDDPTKHVDRARDTHAPSGVTEVPWEAHVPTPAERVEAMAALLSDPGPVRADGGHLGGVAGPDSPTPSPSGTGDVPHRAGLSPEDKELL